MAYVNGEAGAHGAVEEARDPSGAPVVKLVGEIDISNADALGLTLDRLVGDRRDHLVVDLAALEFMDSSGIAMLLHAAARFGSIEIRNPSSIVKRIIECTGLVDVLRIEA